MPPEPSSSQISETLSSIEQRYKALLQEIQQLKNEVASVQADQDTEENLSTLRANIEKLSS